MNRLGRALALIALLLAGNTTGAQAAPATFQLFQLFSDSARTKPRSGEPYSVWLDGRVVDLGVTDENGAVLTRHRVPGTEQEFVLKIFNMGLRSARVDRKGREEVTLIAASDPMKSELSSCGENTADCIGQGYYWLRLVGLDTRFEGEPYSVTIDGRSYSGKVDAQGYIYVDQARSSPSRKGMVLSLCAVPQIEVTAGRRDIDATSVILKPSTRPLADCGNSRLGDYRAGHAQLNRGMPYVFAGWLAGVSPAQAVENDKAAKLAEQADYRQLVQANADTLSWLGRPPPQWDEDAIRARERALMDRIAKDASTLTRRDVLDFKCQAPKDVGPTPDMGAVNAFIAAFPGSMSDARFLGPLEAAAAKGNWLAAVQVYMHERQYKPEGNRNFNRYRLLQLAEWLQARKIGIVYSELEHDLASTGYYSDAPGERLSNLSLYAALHSAYAVQYQVGKLLQQRGDEFALVGKAMQQCAKSALPAYRDILE